MKRTVFGSVPRLHGPHKIVNGVEEYAPHGNPKDDGDITHQVMTFLLFVQET